VPSDVLPAGQYAPWLEQTIAVLECSQNEPAGHVPSDVLPAGQYAPTLVQLVTVLESLQNEPAGHCEHVASVRVPAKQRVPEVYAYPSMHSG